MFSFCAIQFVDDPYRFTNRKDLREFIESKGRLCHRPVYEKIAGVWVWQMKDLARRPSSVGVEFQAGKVEDQREDLSVFGRKSAISLHITSLLTHSSEFCSHLVFCCFTSRVAS